MKRVIRSNRSPNPKVAIVVSNNRRLTNEQHDELLSRIHHIIPYDMFIYDLGDKPEWKDPKKIKYRNSIQIYKHWDALQLLPERYRYIVKVRNDLDVVEAFGVKLAIQKGFEENWTIGMGQINFHKHQRNWKMGKEVFIGDLIIAHPRDAMKDPNMMEKEQEFYHSRVGHRKWAMCFDDKAHHWNAQIKIVRPEGFIPPK